MARVNTGSGWTADPGAGDTPGGGEPGLIYDNFWAWTTSLTAAAAGQVGVNAYNPPTTWAAVTDINIAHIATDGTDATNAFTRLQPGDIIYLQLQTDATRFGRYDLTALPTNNGIWWGFPVKPNVLGSSGRVPAAGAATMVRLLGNL